MPDIPTWKRKKVSKNWLNAGGALAGGRKRGGGARIGFTSADFLLQSMGHHRHAGWLAGRLRFHACVPKIESSLQVGFFSTKVVPGDQIKASRMGGGRKKTEELTTPALKKICLRFAHTRPKEKEILTFDRPTPKSVGHEIFCKPSL